jgi:two-component system OmpR family response regulator
MEPLVLVVDDELALSEGVAAFLEDEGMRVHTAHWGEEAVAYVAAGHPIQVCIVDLRLPGANGTDSIAQIRRVAPEIRFMIHTGSTPDLVATELGRAGLEAVPVFTKPVGDMSDLARTVRALCGTGGD